MANYAIAFDLDTNLMRDEGVTNSQRTSIYQTEITEALAEAGFTAHPQGSLYTTQGQDNPLLRIIALPALLRERAPNFCRYLKRCHVFRMDESSDVTELLSGRPAAATPTGEEVADQQEAINAA